MIMRPQRPLPVGTMRPQKPLPVHRSRSDGVAQGLVAPMVPQRWLLIPPVLMLNAPGAVVVRGAAVVPRMAPSVACVAHAVVVLIVVVLALVSSAVMVVVVVSAALALVKVA